MICNILTGQVLTGADYDLMICIILTGQVLTGSE